MDNIEIKTSMLSDGTSMLSDGSSKPADPDSPVEDAPSSELSEHQVKLIVSTWKIVKDSVTLEKAGIILFTK